MSMCVCQATLAHAWLPLMDGVELMSTVPWLLVEMASVQRCCTQCSKGSDIGSTWAKRGKRVHTPGYSFCDALFTHALSKVCKNYVSAITDVWKECIVKSLPKTLPSRVISYAQYDQGRIEPPKAAKGHVTLYMAKCAQVLKIVF